MIASMGATKAAIILSVVGSQQLNHKNNPLIIAVRSDACSRYHNFHGLEAK